MLRHWSQFVPNMSTDIRGHETLLHHYHRQSGCGPESHHAVTQASSWSPMAQQWTAGRTPPTSGRTHDRRSAPKPTHHDRRRHVFRLRVARKTSGKRTIRRGKKRSLREGAGLSTPNNKTVSRQNFTLNLVHGLQRQSDHGHKREFPRSRIVCSHVILLMT